MALTTISPALQDTQAQYTGFKNRIINGQMQIDQRNAGASGTANGYTVDRWQYYGSQASKLTWQQNAGSVTPPAGFKNYLGFTSSSAYSVLAGDIFEVLQPIEGLNVSDLNWGTANASSVTLSFKVYSSLTGTFGGALQNYNGSRNYPFGFLIPVANTWTTISIPITGDTSGTWLTTNGVGINVVFGLGVGSTYLGTAGSWGSTAYFGVTGQQQVVGTNGATFYITGVQLEKGSTATSFDYRPYGTELALCQRYYWQTSGSASNGYPLMQGYATASNTVATLISFPTTMRSAPTATKNGTWAVNNVGQPFFDYLGESGCAMRATAAGTGMFYVLPDSTDDICTFSSEL